jgi:hypothetical protein
VAVEEAAFGLAGGEGFVGKRTWGHTEMRMGLVMLVACHLIRPVAQNQYMFCFDPQCFATFQKRQPACGPLADTVMPGCIGSNGGDRFTVAVDGDIHRKAFGDELVVGELDHQGALFLPIELIGQAELNFPPDPGVLPGLGFLNPIP